MNFDRRCQRIYQLGCLPCRKRGWFNECQVHHLNEDGKAGQARRGDMYSLGMCPWHHVGEPIGTMTAQQCRRCLGPSLKHESVAFRQMFGTDDQLLEEQNRLIEQAELALVRGKAPPPEAEVTHVRD